jgi:phytoene dehydrogenase-like protein
VSERFDAVVVGSGPNGLGAAATLAKEGRSVLVLEAQDRIGGGARTLDDVTLPGYRHDHCSAIHPLGAASPLFRDLRLDEHGLEWIHPEVQMAHPLDDGSAAALYRSVDRTAETMGPDQARWKRRFHPFDKHWDVVADTALSPILRIPRHPFVMARLGLLSALPVTTLARRAFEGEQARVALGGFAAHAIVPLDRPFTSAAAIVFNAAGQRVGMPVAKGGSQSIADALASYIRSKGGEIRAGHAVSSMDDVPPAGVVLFDLTPKQILAIAGDRLKPRVRRAFKRYKYGNGSFKLDYALSEPIPWKAEACRQASTVHLGSPIEEIARSERDVWEGRHPDRPFVLVGQQSIVDPSRAPDGKQTLWAYCHVPSGSTVDMTDRIEAQLERYAPGFRDTVVARTVNFPADLERFNANIVGGDIAGGSAAGKQILFRPRIALDPYRLADDLFICSQSAPPGPGVHGMCGYFAAKSALRRLPRQ